MPATLPRRLPARLSATGLDPQLVARAGAFAALALAVLLGHQWLLGQLGRWLQRSAASAVEPAPTAPARTWRLSPAAPPPAALPAAEAPADTARQAPARTAPARRAGSAPPGPATSAPAFVSEAPTDAASPPAAEPAEPPVAPESRLGQAAGALPAPPVYPTRVPPSTELRFSVRRGAQSGQGLWRWQADDGQYRSELQAELGGRPWLAQHSQGGFDGAGLAPERLVESQLGRAARAVNFQREKRVLSFSGSTRSWPLWPGTQDRLSWLPQLLAVVGGRSAWQPGDRLVLATASPRGELALWEWTLQDRQGPGDLPPAAGLMHWVREPQRPYDHRVDLWLSAQAPHWPQGWQWQTLPGGEPVRWWREVSALGP